MCRLVACLPVSNQLLLRHLVNVLRHVCDNAAVNDMTPYNLATCIGQCMLWPSSRCSLTADNQLSSAKKLNQIVQFMIDRAELIFGVVKSPGSPSADNGSSDDSKSASLLNKLCFSCMILEFSKRLLNKICRFYLRYLTVLEIV